MCGIVGYVGNKSVVNILLDGLEQLEYRGYDSSGVAVMCDSEIKVYKAIGKLQNLRNELSGHEKNILNLQWGLVISDGQLMELLLFECSPTHLYLWKFGCSS